MRADELLVALDEAIDCPTLRQIPRSDRLALAAWWLVDRLSIELQTSPAVAAAQVAIMCDAAAEMMGDRNHRPVAHRLCPAVLRTPRETKWQISPVYRTRAPTPPFGQVFLAKSELGDIARRPRSWYMETRAKLQQGLTSGPTMLLSAFDAIDRVTQAIQLLLGIREDAVLTCEMTGRSYVDVSEGIWDDGEFISWDWINGQLHRQERQNAFPVANAELIEVFDELVATAVRYREVTGRYLPIFGELGELYAELRYGLKRNRAHAPGADGRIGNDHVEVKTISPVKKKQRIQLKRRGNFNKVIVVRISADFEFDSRMFERRRLRKGTGKFAGISWKSLDPGITPSGKDAGQQAVEVDPPKMGAG